MRIAIDLRRIENAGMWRYALNLVESHLAQAPENAYILIYPRASGPRLPLHGPNIEIVEINAPYYSFREQWELPLVLKRSRADVFHSPHFLLPVIRPCRTIVTIHDVIHLVWKEDIPSLHGRIYARGMMELSVRLSDAILTVSEFSKQEIERHLPASRGKIHVAPLGVDQDICDRIDPAEARRIKSKYNLEKPYILFLGICRRRKNHAGLIRAFARLMERNLDLELVIAGPMHNREAPLRVLAEELGLGHRVRFLGALPEEDLTGLYLASHVYACPSLYEGFGNTVLEAMACRIPVVASTHSSLPEVAGSGALLADPDNIEEFSEALRRAAMDTNLREQLILRGLENLRRFSWRRHSQISLRLYGSAFDSSASMSMSTGTM